MTTCNHRHLPTCFMHDLMPPAPKHKPQPKTMMGPTFDATLGLCGAPWHRDTNARAVQPQRRAHTGRAREHRLRQVRLVDAAHLERDVLAAASVLHLLAPGDAAPANCKPGPQPRCTSILLWIACTTQRYLTTKLYICAWAVM